MTVRKCEKCNGLLKQEFDETRQPYLYCLNCGKRTYPSVVSSIQRIRNAVMPPPLERLPTDAWHENGAIVSVPWRFPTKASKRGTNWTENKFFEKDRGDSKFKQGGSVEVQVYLAGAWHWMRFTTDGEAFRKLAKMPDRSRALLLESLGLVPIRANLLLPSDAPQRSRGSSRKNAGFWYNMDYWTPHLQKWAAECRVHDGFHPLYSAALKKTRHGTLNMKRSETLAGALAVLAWKCLHLVNKDRFPMPTGKNLVNQVAARIQKTRKAREEVYRETLSIRAAVAQFAEKHSNEIDPSILAELDLRREALRKKEATLKYGINGPLLPLPIKDWVRAILENDTRKIPVISPPEEFGPSVFMTDFRMF